MTLEWFIQNIIMSGSISLTMRVRNLENDDTSPRSARLHSRLNPDDPKLLAAGPWTVIYNLLQRLLFYYSIPEVPTTT